MLVGRVRILIRQAKPNQYARHFECVVHLRDERDRTAFTNEDGFLSESFFPERSAPS